MGGHIQDKEEALIFGSAPDSHLRPTALEIFASLFVDAASPKGPTPGDA